MIDVKELAPPSGSRHIVVFEITKYGETQPPFFVTDGDFNKSYDAAAGEGSITAFYTPEVYKKIPKHSEFLLKAGWLFPDGTTILKEVMSGYIKDVKISGNEIKIDLIDYGYLLDANASVSYTNKKRSFIIKDLIKKAGLIPEVDFTGVTDDVLSVFPTPTSTDGGGDGPSGIGKPSDGCKKTYPYEKWWQTTAENKCPRCGKTGTIVYGRATSKTDVIKPCGRAEDPGIVEGHYFCCTNLGGCDADFCMVCGKDHGNKSGTPLKIIDGPKEVAGPEGAPSKTTESTETGDALASDKETKDNASASTTTSATATESDTRTYWDMLIELCDPINHDLQIFVWMKTCYVRKVPDQETAVLFVDGEVNMIHNTLELEEGDSMTQNAVKVTYGKGANPSSVVVRDDELADKYGDNVAKFNMPNYTREQALAYASKQLDKIQRDSGFSISCSVIGSPEWYICRWVLFRSKRHDIQDVYYILSFSTAFSSTSCLKTDLTMGVYRPTLSSSASAQTGNMGNIEGILSTAAKFKYGSNCGTGDCIEKKGMGDCWNMSEWLYNKLTLAGVRARIVEYPTSMSPRHRSVQIYTNDKWEDLPYDKYGFSRNFKATSGSQKGKVLKGG